MVFPDHMGAKWRYNFTTISEKEVEATGAAETIGDVGELGATIFVIDLCFFLLLLSELSLFLRFFSSIAILRKFSKEVVEFIA